MTEEERQKWEEEDLREAVAQRGVVVTPLVRWGLKFAVMRRVVDYRRLGDR